MKKIEEIGEGYIFTADFKMSNEQIMEMCPYNVVTQKDLKSPSINSSILWKNYFLIQYLSESMFFIASELINYKNGNKIERHNEIELLNELIKQINSLIKQKIDIYDKVNSNNFLDSQKIELINKFDLGFFNKLEESMENVIKHFRFTAKEKELYPTITQKNYNERWEKRGTKLNYVTQHNGKAERLSDLTFNMNKYKLDLAEIRSIKRQNLIYKITLLSLLLSIASIILFIFDLVGVI